MIALMLENKGLPNSKGEDITGETNEWFLEAFDIYENDFYASIGRSGEVIQKRFKQKVLEENLYGAAINRISDYIDDLVSLTILELGSGTGGFNVALALKWRCRLRDRTIIVASIETSKK